MPTINYYVGIGGTGARLLESIVRLCECGYIKADIIRFLMIDSDVRNGNVTRTEDLIESYTNFRNLLNKPESAPLFKTELSKYGANKTSPFNPNENALTTSIEDIAETGGISAKNRMKTFFGNSEYMKFDATLAMYYDQGSIPFRSIAFEGGICYWADLPYIITTSDQGVSYEKAGKNASSEFSLRNALYCAIDIFKIRKLNGEIYANPLKKQYFERGSDNEKLDLSSDG